MRSRSARLGSGRSDAMVPVRKALPLPPELRDRPLMLILLILELKAGDGARLE